MASLFTEPSTRRARLARRHRLAGDADGPVEAARSVLVLHATDPATVYLSVLARSSGTTIDDVAAALYDERALVRMMAMRRTLFVVPTDLVPVVHHGAALDVAAWIRRRLVRELQTAPTDPPVPADADAWLGDVERGVESALADLGTASGAELAVAEPRLRTAVLPTTDKTYDVRRNVTSSVLVLMGTEGRIVRGRPAGGWTSRRHVWEAATTWWPAGMPVLDVDEARRRLVAGYLRAYGPASVADVAWWTGWPLGRTRTVLAQLDTVGSQGLLVLADDVEAEDPVAPVAALLPALDPTPMGWKQREWYLPEPAGLFDRNGNVGPTAWWDGEVVGAWATRADGTVATRVTVDRGAEAVTAVTAEAARWEERLAGRAVTPSFRTPLSTELAGS